eukprot:5053147-Amphidinium_carterae.1
MASNARYWGRSRSHPPQKGREGKPPSLACTRRVQDVLFLGDRVVSDPPFVTSDLPIVAYDLPNVCGE